MSFLLFLLALLHLGGPTPGEPVPWPPPAHRWTPGPALDQGGVPACAAYALMDWLHATPAPETPAWSAETLYERIQLHDGRSFGQGAAPATGVALLQAAGLAGPDATWIVTATAAVQFMQTTGPILVISGWPPSAPVGAGTHAYLCFGWDPPATLTCQNSWGAGHNLFTVPLAAYTAPGRWHLFGLLHKPGH